ncbi:hypothetical protein GN958_ATG02909 [Phytophthora infestans]|uniref:Uncharacterized protein n=1 Tax=Phytophthora infestans TaxID=4787 RepID=A0A8S9V730_PHYIN|nr:hypothetical protein GN958_ATG02909 [Phytophthora infestans]
MPYALLRLQSGWPRRSQQMATYHPQAHLISRMQGSLNRRKIGGQVRRTDQGERHAAQEEAQGTKGEVPRGRADLPEKDSYW